MGKQALSYFTIGMKVGSIPTEENLAIYSKLVCANTLKPSNLISSHLPQNMGKIYIRQFIAALFLTARLDTSKMPIKEDWRNKLWYFYKPSTKQLQKEKRNISVVSYEEIFRIC